jgi:hypothetical protein
MNGGMGGDQKHERVDGDDDNDINPDDNDHDDASTKSLLVEVDTWIEMAQTPARSRERRIIE